MAEGATVGESTSGAAASGCQKLSGVCFWLWGLFLAAKPFKNDSTDTGGAERVKPDRRGPGGRQGGRPDSGTPDPPCAAGLAAPDSQGRPAGVALRPRPPAGARAEPRSVPGPRRPRATPPAHAPAPTGLQACRPDTTPGPSRETPARLPTAAGGNPPPSPHQRQHRPQASVVGRAGPGAT